MAGGWFSNFLRLTKFVLGNSEVLSNGKYSMNDKHDERIAKMSFATVYPLYVAKVEKKGRTKEELQQVIEWLTGFNRKQQQQLIEGKSKL